MNMYIGYLCEVMLRYFKVLLAACYIFTSLLQEQAQMTMFGQAGGANMANMAAMEQSRMLAHTLAQNTDPKFQVCEHAHASCAVWKSFPSRIVSKNIY